jgi:hypothetical protein
MRSKFSSLLLVAAFLLMAVSAFAQDPLSGTWSGDWGPNRNDRNDVTLVLKWDGKALTGNVTGGRDVIAPLSIQKGTFDPKTSAVHMEVDTKDRSGQTVRFVIDGKLDKGTMAGTWNHDYRKGDFKLTKQ